MVLLHRNYHNYYAVSLVVLFQCSNYSTIIDINTDTATLDYTVEHTSSPYDVKVAFGPCRSAVGILLTLSISVCIKLLLFLCFNFLLALLAIRAMIILLLASLLVLIFLLLTAVILLLAAVIVNVAVVVEFSAIVAFSKLELVVVELPVMLISRFHVGCKTTLLKRSRTLLILAANTVQ